MSASARTALALAALLLAWPGRAGARPDTPGTTELFRYDVGDVVEAHDSPGGSFRVHFTRAGTNAVPLLDADDSGVPDHVERVAVIYDEVLAFYQGELGFRAPLDDGALADAGGDDRFDVYLLDFGGSADGAFRTDACGVGGVREAQCVGFMVHENDFAGYGYPSVDYANRLLASHELFHAVQAAYDANEGSVPGEGTAVWASQAFDPTLRDLEAFAAGYLDHTDRPIDRPLPGPVDPFSYGASIFFQYLSERFGDDVIRQLWEACEGDDWLPALDALLAAEHGSSFASAFRDFAHWNLFTDYRADPSRAYADGGRYPLVHAESVTLPHRSSPLRVFYASAQYFSMEPSSRATVAAELVGDHAGVEAVIAVRRGRAIEIASGAVADTDDADEVFVIVVSPASMGESRRPALCIGTPDEVATCRAELEGMADAGAIDADAGVVTVSDAGSAPAGGGDGCSCAAAGARRAPPSATALVLIVLARAAVARRRSRARRA